jgi:hypothetical protein
MISEHTEQLVDYHHLLRAEILILFTMVIDKVNNRTNNLKK